ncbi:hypothetical protein BLOT_003542 [Blomia tropicalis]|nr:hypothetical protein BLOT_003542 [Blomia tropicalis]
MDLKKKCNSKVMSRSNLESINRDLPCARSITNEYMQQEQQAQQIIKGNKMFHVLRPTQCFTSRT